MKLTNLFTSLLAAIALAHPGEVHTAEEIAEEHAKREIHAAHIARGLDACSGKQSYERLMKRASIRLSKKAADLRIERGLDQQTPYFTKRNLAQLKKWQKVSHNKTSSGFTKKTKPAKLFASYSNTSCILTPEVTQGPYWITGEYVRQNVVEKQKGVPLHLEYQFIDTNTCDAVQGLYVENWHVNATGVYSGVVANSNGNFADKSNINATFLRGAQKTGAAGVASFDTIFPGHYQGRATHIHMLAMHDGTLHKNNATYDPGTISHVGQIFFEQSLINAVEATAPYSKNTQRETANNADMIAQQAATAKYDPFPQYAYLGDSVSDGLLMWINIGIDMDAAYTVQAAGRLTAEGGVANSNGGGGGGPGGPP